MAKTQVTGLQLRAVRGLVRWTVRTLDKKAKVYENTIAEKGRRRGKDETLEALRTALEKAGVEAAGGEAGAFK